MPPITVHVARRARWPALAPTWERLHAASAEPSFMLSRAWVECWLAIYGETLDPELVTFARGDEIVGCCLLVWRTAWVRGVPFRRVYLNCSGEAELDSTCIEYNTLIARPADAPAVVAALAGHLRWRYWDELVLDGLTATSPLRALIDATAEVAELPSHYLALDTIRGSRGGLDAALSANTRSQIRRSLRTYEAGGARATLRVAATATEAAAMFGRLAALHQVAWRDRGAPGVFASVPFTAFHERLIATTFAAGHILLAELTVGDAVVGALYSFVDRGRLYFYQSGFAYAADAKLKPGLVTHYLAIAHCLERTAITEYDFLAGDSQYKRSLASAQRPLRWAIVRRPTLPNLIRRGVRIAKRVVARFRDSAAADGRSPAR